MDPDRARRCERDRQGAGRRGLAQDWAAFAADLEAQDVEFALAAQAEVVTGQPIN